MMNDAAMLVFDNIREGTLIDCPHLAKYVTAGSIADRGSVCRSCGNCWRQR